VAVLEGIGSAAKCSVQRRQSVLLALAALLVLPAIYSLTRSNSAKKSVLTLISEPYRLDKIYRSMEGPWSVQSEIQLPAQKSPTVQWVTGVEAEVVDAVQQKPISQEFFCHSNLTFAEHKASPDQYNKELGGKTYLDWRLFTLVPGRLSIELPPGFGVPVPSNARLDYVTMSLNLNPGSDGVDVRMRTNVLTVAAD